MNTSLKTILRIAANYYIVLFSVFVMTFFAVNEKFDLALGPKIVFPIVILLTATLLFWKGKTNISDYILLPVIILDGFFHLTSPLDNLIKNSPDWVIALNLFQGKGMPVIVHQIMGIFLLSTSSWFIYLLVKKKRDWQYFLYKYAISIVTLTIISFSYVIKLYK